MPGPGPLPPEVIWIQDRFELAFQVQPVWVLTLKLPLPPAAVKERLGGLTE